MIKSWTFGSKEKVLHLRSNALARLPHTFGGTDLAAVPHPTRRKTVSTCLLRLRSILGASCQLLRGVIGEGGHDVAGVAEAIITCVEVWGVLLALGTRSSLGWLWLAWSCRAPCAE